MTTKIIIAIVLVSTFGIIGLAVWQQQKRLPALQAAHPTALPSRPPGLDPNGAGQPMDFAALFNNLKPAKQDCLRSRFGERFSSMLTGSATLSAADNQILGECLLAGATFETAPDVPAQ